jgi:hypothetical protein
MMIVRIIPRSKSPGCREGYWSKLNLIPTIDVSQKAEKINEAKEKEQFCAEFRERETFLINSLKYRSNIVPYEPLHYSQKELIPIQKIKLKGKEDEMKRMFKRNLLGLIIYEL